MIRWALVLAALALIAWFLTHRAVPQPVRDPVADAPWQWGPGKNAFDCEKDAPVNPLPPELDAAQRARVLAVLKQACQETK